MWSKLIHEHDTSKKALVLKAIRTKLNTQYPSSWFALNPGKKPTVHIKKTTLTIPEMKQAIVKGIADGKLNRDLAKAYLAAMATMINSTLDSDWTTYNIVIGKKNETINIGNLIDIQDATDGLDQIVIGNSAHEATDFDVLLVVLFIHRMSRLNPNAPTDKFIKNIRKLLQGRDTPLFKNVTRVAEYVSWQSDKDFNKLVAAYDMFFFKFLRHDLSALRYGTVTTRFRACAGLISFGHVANVLGIKEVEILDWIFHNKTGDEIEKLFVEDLKESINHFSYFPYQADFGLVMKSSYSSVAVPNLFLLHVIGCFMRSTRSINARMNTEANIDILIKNALIVAVVHKTMPKLPKVYTSTGLPLRLDVDQMMDKGDRNKDPDNFLSRSASEVFEFMSKRQFKPTPAMIKMLNQYKKDMKECRDGTIGKFLQTYSLE